MTGRAWGTETRTSERRVSDRVRYPPRRSLVLSGKHNLSEDDVIYACGNGLERAGWEDDPEHGRRLLVRGQTPNKRRIRVFLYPIPGERGAFRLGTAF